MSFLGNIIWFVFGGAFLSLGYVISSLLLMITIIGIPFGFETLKLATVALWPFGKTILNEPTQNGPIPLFLNIIWLLVGGIWICLFHVLLGLSFAISIIGIPFAIQHFKLASLAISPFGKKFVSV